MALVRTVQGNLSFQIGPSAPRNHVVRSLPLGFLYQVSVCEFSADNCDVVAVLVSGRAGNTRRRKLQFVLARKLRFGSEELENVFVGVSRAVVLQWHCARALRGRVKFPRIRSATIRIHVQAYYSMDSFINHPFGCFSHGSDTRARRSVMGPSQKRTSGRALGPRNAPVVWYGSMFDKNSRGFSCSDRPAESTDSYSTCPRCETVILALVTRGPSDHRIDPCGCQVSTFTARDLVRDATAQLATDGGQR